MARIGLFDSYSRKRVGDKSGFDNLILNPLREDLIANTWLRERYSCDGTQQLVDCYMCLVLLAIFIDILTSRCTESYFCLL